MKKNRPGYCIFKINVVSLHCFYEKATQVLHLRFKGYPEPWRMVIFVASRCNNCRITRKKKN